MKARIVVMLTLVVAMLFSGFASAAQATTPTPTPSRTPTPAPTGFVRVIHASPNAPAVDIYLDGAATPAIPNLAFGAATPFIELPVKVYSVQVRAAGSDPKGKPVFEKKNIRLARGVSANIIAAGELNGKNRQAFDLIVYASDRSAIKPNETRVEVFHASPDAPAVDVLVNGGAAVRSLVFKSGIRRALNVPAASYNLQVVPAGKKEPVVIDAKGVPLEANKVYTILAIGKLGDKTIKPLVLSAAPR